MRIAYLDCFAGAAGDMLVGACIDAGAGFAEVERALARLGLAGVRLAAREVQRGSIGATQFIVEIEEHAEHGDDHAHARHLPEIEAIVRRADYEPRLEARMLAAFRALAEAEARAHRMPIDEVHFHEVGAADAIVDICGAVLAFDMLGVERIYCSEVVVGTGTVECAHGTLPVPAPGTLALLQGIPIRAGSLAGERCTPTGAALLRVLVDHFAEPVSYRPLGIGYGAGARDAPPVPNVVRVTLGEAADPLGADLVWELSCQVDNASGELLGHALRVLIERGALDAWLAPIVTKKNRPAHAVVALAAEAQRPAVEDALLAELPTLGLRKSRVERRTLPRRVITRTTPLGDVRFKERTLPDGSKIAHPEAEDLERLAREHGLSLPQVLARLHGA